jgi:hypothetical protein
MTETVLCTKCGKQNPDDIAFCSYCGSPLINLEGFEDESVFQDLDSDGSTHTDEEIISVNCQIAGERLKWQPMPPILIARYAAPRMR